MKYGIDDVDAEPGPRPDLPIAFREWEEIPMHSIYLVEYMEAYKPWLFTYHWGFKDSEEWFNCTKPMSFSMGPKQAIPFLPHIPVWKMPGCSTLKNDA